jgi:hypothetical protein
LKERNISFCQAVPLRATCMRKALLFILTLSTSNFSFAQKYVFDSGGTMERSQMYIDTVFKTTLKTQNGIFFKKLDITYIDSIKIKKYIPNKLAFILKDTFDYFVLANLTNKIIKLKRVDNQLVTEEFSRYENFGFKPISFFMYPNYSAKLNNEDLNLNPSEILIFKDRNKKRETYSKEPPDCFMKLLTSTNGVLVSEKYKKASDNSNHYIDSGFEKYFNSNRNLLAFPEE